MRHSCEEGHDHAERYPASEEDKRRMGWSWVKDVFVEVEAPVIASARNGHGRIEERRWASLWDGLSAYPAPSSELKFESSTF